MKDNLIVVSAFVLIGLFFWGASYAIPRIFRSEQRATVIEVVERNDDPKTERSREEFGDYDCSDFSSQAEAQEFFEDQGGPEEDFHNLDRDGDGFVCESFSY